MQTYVTVDDFKAVGNANIDTDKYDPRLLPHLEAVSRQIEGYLGRYFYPKMRTRYFSGNGSWVMPFPGTDIISITTLKEDDDGDGVYEETWTENTDFFLAPYEDDRDPTSLTSPLPYWKLEADRRVNAGTTKGWFGRGQRRFEMVGKFGYCEMVKATGATINEGASFGAADTELTVDDGSLVHVGDTLVIESEYLYVSGEDVPDGNDITVVRGVNGSTAAAHADTTVISRLVYPPAVVQAVLMQASRLWQRRASNYSSDVGYLDTGAVSPGRGLDQDVRQLLDPYKRVTIA